MTAVEWLINAWVVKGTLCAEDMVKAKEMEKLRADATIQLQNLKDEAEVNNKIIAAQEELIQLQYQAIEVRNKFIAMLESQLTIQDNAINREI